MEGGTGTPGAIIEKHTSPALAIPDNNLEGIISSIDIDEEGTIDLIEELTVNISHSYRGDLLVSLITPDNDVINLHQGQGGGADNLIESYSTGTTPALQQLEGKNIQGTWLLKVADRWSADTGTLNSWGLRIRVLNNIVRVSVSPGIHIPDDDPQGIVSAINVSSQGQVKEIKVNVDISHTYTGDLTVTLTSPSNKKVTLHNMTGGTTDNLQAEYSRASHPQLSDFLDENIFGEWKLAVADHLGFDVGKLNQWGVELIV
jgi:subtilisin-like proprotein convertase family protein